MTSIFKRDKVKRESHIKMQVEIRVIQPQSQNDKSQPTIRNVKGYFNFRYLEKLPHT